MEWLPYAISIGMSKESFWESTPRELKIYAKSNEIRLKVQDEMMWSMCGNYVMSAVAVAIDYCMHGNKAKSKYIDTPITRHIQEEKTEELELTEEELQRQREAFVQSIEAMRMRFQEKHNKT